MMLTAAQLAARENKLTASKVGVLVNGTPQDIRELWEFMVGLRPEPDLSDVWAVQLGTVTEALNLEWFARRYGHDLTRHGEVVVHPLHEWAACTLDAMTEIGPVDAKHTSAWMREPDLIERYSAQLHWQMFCTGTYVGFLSVIYGSSEPQLIAIPFDEGFMRELFQRAEDFMTCVREITPPEGFEPIAPPVPVSEMREVEARDASFANEWASLATDWLDSRDGAKTFARSEKELKALVEVDVKRVSGFGIECKRSRNGALRITEVK